VTARVQLEVRDAQDAVVRLFHAAARYRLDAREQLGEREGLGKVVVRSQVEPLNPILDLATRGPRERHDRD